MLMSEISPVETPNDGSLDRLCEKLGDLASKWSTVDHWPEESLRMCGAAGVYRWFLAESEGGLGWSEADQTRGYLRLAAADLTTTFIITQYMGAIRRIAGSANRSVAERWLPQLICGDAFATVGISHLTTSRQHLGQPALVASETDRRFVLDGQAPWVTGAPHADLYVIGASLSDGREILAAVDRSISGIAPGRGVELVALSASCTDRVVFQGVTLDESMVLAGPIENVMSRGVGAGTGGLQTSTLAIGLSRAAVNYLAAESATRENLRHAADELTSEVDRLESWLLRAADGDAACDATAIRGSANGLVLRSTQAALTAAKGAGYVDGHPVGRWCREALFFLVWSCPQPIAQAYLCELAGID
jgi:alkylation response protein AidB-like acyl-CoA dehydrogenase